jgi:hypothetical protein
MPDAPAKRRSSACTRYDGWHSGNANFHTTKKPNPHCIQQSVISPAIPNNIPRTGLPDILSTRNEIDAAPDSFVYIHAYNKNILIKDFQQRHTRQQSTFQHRRQYPEIKPANHQANEQSSACMYTPLFFGILFRFRKQPRPTPESSGQPVTPN